MSGVAVWSGWGCVACLVITALVHSIAGERMLIAPLLRRRRDRLLEVPLARFVLRFGWHMMSIAFVLIALLLWLLLTPDGPTARAPFLITGMVFAAVGLIDMVASRGRHIGWPLLALTGILGLIAGLA